MVDSVCDEGEDNEEDDYYYRYHVVFLRHGCDLECERGGEDVVEDWLAQVRCDGLVLVNIATVIYGFDLFRIDDM